MLRGVLSTTCMARVIIESVRCARDARGFVFEPIGVESIAPQQNVHVAMTEPGGICGNHLHHHATETTVVLGPALASEKAPPARGAFRVSGSNLVKSPQPQTTPMSIP